MDPKMKMGCEESEKPKEAEMEMDYEVLQEERVEIQSQRRKVIRIESEETQDYVCDTLAISEEEADESELRGVIYWCDNQCSDKALRYMQIASMVIEEGGEAHTINSCQQCHNEKLMQ